ncbi:MAG TPA: NAD-dependent epimerase/dehydratase family protein, partial [Polyangiales bacterium]|nr:NAD-dependent epimerase/dehydratase family protein [Polyangiales bacterium]
ATSMLAAYLADSVAYLNDIGAYSAPCRLSLWVRSPERAQLRLGHLLNRKDVTVIRRDLREPWPTTITPDYFVHAASPPGPRDYLADPLGALDANTHCLRQLLERAKCSAGVLFVSSSEVYGTPDPEAIPTPETYVGRIDPLSRRAYYAEAKRAGETYCRAYHEVHGVPVKIVRPFHIHGPGLRADDARLVPALIQMGLSGKPLSLESDGRATRTYGYVSDATIAMLRVLCSEQQGEAYNIGADQPETSVLELASCLAEIFGQTEPVKTQTAPGLETARGAPQRARPDTSKLKAAFGLECRVGLREGLMRTVRWTRQS